MLVTAAGLAGLTTIEVDTPFWQLALWQLIIGAGSGLFNSPNTSAVMGVVPADKRGIGAGMRAMLTSTGFVISIALAIGLVTTSMDPSVLAAVFSGTQVGGAGIDMGPFINALHVAFAAGLVVSLIGAVISATRGGHRSWDGEAGPGGAGGGPVPA
jgi:MFS family permease